MYEAIQAVSHILDLNQLLDRILELIFRSIDADRGCIMLRATSPDGTAAADLSTGAELEPKAVRWRGGVSRQEKIPVSRTIMDHVLREKQGVLVSDAARDERFQSVQSIVRFGIREVICVPMKGRHETLGVLYLDTRTTAREVIAAGNPTGKFTADHLALAVAIAHQAALAVEETRYHQALVQAERLAAVGQTIAALSHHIKNILQGLQSGGEILKMGIEDKDDQALRQGWAIVEKNQGKIYELVMDMLSYSKDREPALEETDLNAVARDVVELLAPRAKELGVTLSTELDAGPAEVPGRPGGRSPGAAEHRRQRSGRRGGVRGAGRDRVHAARAGRQMAAHRGDGQRPRRAAGEAGGDLPAVRQHEGVARHRAGPGGQPQDPPRARRRHRAEEPGRPGQHVRLAAADAQPRHAGNSQHPGRAAAGGGVRSGFDTGPERERGGLPEPPRSRSGLVGKRLCSVEIL